MESTTASYDNGHKRVYYLSLEFLIGRLLFDAMTNLGVAEPMAEALREAASWVGCDDVRLEQIEPAEHASRLAAALA
jgi:starch phosphorylase